MRQEVLKPKSVIKYGDLGTSIRHTRGELRKEIVSGRLFAVLKNISVLNTMAKRNLISSEQYFTGIRLWEIKQKADGYKSCEHRERVDGGKMIFHTLEQLTYIDLYNKIVKKLTPYQRKIIEHVVVNDNPLTNRTMLTAKRRGVMLEFKKALDRLFVIFRNNQRDVY